MRMWMINPKLMCNKHLIGEHGELHKFIPYFKKQHSIAGRVHPVVQIQFIGYESRHQSLVYEMVERGMNHNSPIEMVDFKELYPQYYKFLEVDKLQSIKDLSKRCPKCKVLLRQAILHAVS